MGGFLRRLKVENIFMYIFFHLFFLVTSFDLDSVKNVKSPLSFHSAFHEVRLHAINAGYALVIAFDTVFPHETVTEYD